MQNHAASVCDVLASMSIMMFSCPNKPVLIVAAINFMEASMVRKTYVLERVTRVLLGAGITADTAGLALRIMRTIHAGDDIGNGLRAIPIEALDELKTFLNQDAHQPG